MKNFGWSSLILTFDSRGIWMKSFQSLAKLCALGVRAFGILINFVSLDIPRSTPFASIFRTDLGYMVCVCVRVYSLRCFEPNLSKLFHFGASIMLRPWCEVCISSGVGDVVSRRSKIEFYSTTRWWKRNWLNDSLKFFEALVLLKDASVLCLIFVYIDDHWRANASVIVTVSVQQAFGLLRVTPMMN